MQRSNVPFQKKTLVDFNQRNLPTKSTNKQEQTPRKRKLIDFKRTTSITTKAIATHAHLSVPEVFVVEVGGCTSWELAQLVVMAFNELSGMEIKMDDILLASGGTYGQSINGK